MQNGPDVVLGGGWRHFIPSEQKSSKRDDNRDVLSELTAAGYTKVGNRKELMTFNPQKNTKALIFDVIEFDDALRVALEYQASHADVAVIVTVDHETGGLGLGRESEYELSIDDLSEIPNSIEHACESIIEDPSSAMTVAKDMF